MPSKPKKPCAYPGCPNLTHDTYCEEHEALRQKQYETDTAVLITMTRSTETIGEGSEQTM